MKLNWYVVSVRTGSENSVIDKLEKHFDNGIARAFVPLMEVFHRYANNVITKENKILFPGYVFVESGLNDVDFLGEIKDFSRKNNCNLKVLKYDDSCDLAMREDEKLFLMSLCNNDGNIEVSEGLIEGDKIIVTQGPLIGKESMIKKINRHRREAIVELEILGKIVPVTLGLDILKKRRI